MKLTLLAVLCLSACAPDLPPSKGSPEWFEAEVLGKACSVESPWPRAGVTMDEQSVDLVYCVRAGDIDRSSAGDPLCLPGCPRGRVTVWKGSLLELKLEASYP